MGPPGLCYFFLIMIISVIFLKYQRLVFSQTIFFWGPKFAGTLDGPLASLNTMSCVSKSNSFSVPWPTILPDRMDTFHFPPIKNWPFTDGTPKNHHESINEYCDMTLGMGDSGSLVDT